MTEPRILLFDLENAPSVGYTWGPKWDTSIIEFTEPWYILCVGYKWLGEKETHVFGIDDTDYEWDDDLGVVEKLHALFNEADILVAHNADRFDIPKARARMIVHGMTPPSPSKSVDTLKVARKEFSFMSNKLDDVCETLGIGRKMATGGFDLWKGCMAGDLESWKKMKAYCGSDVDLLEKLYLRLRPWAARQPNLATLSDIGYKCPRCGSAEGEFQKRGWAYNAVTKKQQYRHSLCGAFIQGREVVKSEAKFVN